MKITQNEKGKLEFVTNFMVGKIGLEKAARFFSGVKSSKDFLNTLDRMDFAGTDTEPLEMPGLPVENPEDKQKPANKGQKSNGNDGDTLPLPEIKFGGCR